MVLQPFCWKGTAAGPKQSRGFLKFTDAKFPTEVIKELMWGDTLLDLVLRNKILGYRYGATGETPAKGH